MAEHIDRRQFLRNSVLTGGVATALASFEEKALSAETNKATPVPAAATIPGVEPLALPKGKIKNLEVSRVFCGGNLIGGWAHSRDLMYVSPLIKAYHSDEKIFETLRLAEHRGINTVLTNPVSDRVINAYWKAGGKIQWFSDCASGKLKDGIKRSIDNGAHGVYIQGGMCDKLVMEGKIEDIEDAVSFMEDSKVAFGLGAHCLETVKECVRAGFDPDFWVKTLHKDDYWSATPAENRHVFDEVGGSKKDHGMHHDNMWCINAQETIDFMSALKKPWIAFKTLAAGAIHPRNALQWCFENGADFLCVGMFDFQVAENTEIADKALQAVMKKGRARAWA